MSHRFNSRARELLRVRADLIAGSSAPMNDASFEAAYEEVPAAL